MHSLTLIHIYINTHKLSQLSSSSRCRSSVIRPRGLHGSSRALGGRRPVVVSTSEGHRCGPPVCTPPSPSCTRLTPHSSLSPRQAQLNWLQVHLIASCPNCTPFCTQLHTQTDAGAHTHTRWARSLSRSRSTHTHTHTHTGTRMLMSQLAAMMSCAPGTNYRAAH